MGVTRQSNPPRVRQGYGSRRGFARVRGAFTLIELLVVMGIIALLVSLLIPAVSRVISHAKWVNCQSNMRQVGVHLLMYVQNNQGFLYPVGPKNPINNIPLTLGENMPRDLRWPVYVFEPAVWNPRSCDAPTTPTRWRNTRTF